MVEFKVVISDPKTGRSVQREVKEENAKNLVGLKIGDNFKGELIDLTGYEFQITGGSDYCGFPMRQDVPGSARKKILGVKGVGLINKKKARGKDVKYMRTMKGMRQRVTVAGNTIFDKTAQVNLKIVKIGKENIFPEPKKEEKPAKGAAAPAAPAEAPKETPKAEKPVEAKPEEKKTEKKAKPAKVHKAEEKKAA